MLQQHSEEFIYIGGRKSLSIAKNHPKPSQEFSEQFGPSIHKMKGSGRNSPQKVHPNSAENLGREIFGNTFSGGESGLNISNILKFHPQSQDSFFFFCSPISWTVHLTNPNLADGVRRSTSATHLLLVLAQFEDSTRRLFEWHVVTEGEC